MCVSRFSWTQSLYAPSLGFLHSQLLHHVHFILTKFTSQNWKLCKKSESSVAELSMAKTPRLNIVALFS